MTQGLLFFLPVLALVAALLTRRYPGERAVLRLRERRAAAVPSRPPALPCLRIFTLARPSVRGGELLGRSLAVRPPPSGCIAAG